MTTITIDDLKIESEYSVQEIRIKFLEDRRLDAQYKKARKYILSGN